jgi:hypothetical protein
MIWGMDTTCTHCGRPVRSHARKGLCKVCVRICACGQPKDHRADRCASCATREKAVQQWANPKTRKRIYKAICKARKQTRITWDDLTEASFTQVKADGRRFASYRDNGGNKRTVYRYQWRWIKRHGRIPAGMVVHHHDHDCTNDDLGNLRLMSPGEHSREHKPSANVPERTCLHCGKAFAAYDRTAGVPRKFCSRDCRYAWARSSTILK